jgi:hypothetical protein
MPLTTFEKVVLSVSAVAIILGATLANLLSDDQTDHSDAANLFAAFSHERTRPRPTRYPYSRGTISIEEID